jgi:hypothetical protein
MSRHRPTAPQACGEEGDTGIADQDALISGAY